MSAQVLDYKRLGKQRIEARQVYNILMKLNKSSAWTHHPAVLMWKGFEEALADYYNHIRKEWIERGYNNTMPELVCNNPVMPCWLGDYDFHAAHRSNLKRKNIEFYGKYKWTEPDNLPYIWPRNNTK